MITLRTTAAGRAALNAALAGDGPAPVLDRMAIGGGTPPDPATVTAADIAAQQLQSAVQLAIAKHSSDIISGDAGFDAPAVADTVTWVALLYADGTPAAVGAIDGGLARIPGLRLELPWAWSSTDAGELALSINILDLSVLAAQVSQRAYDDLDTRSGGIVNTYLTPFASAVDTLMAHGNPRVHLESWTPQFRLRAADAVRVVGVIAGDDSLDLAEHTDTLQEGDYVLFDGENSELVRLRANLDLGRRRLVGDIQHTYPAATLSRTNWLITAGQATALAGQVYHSDTLRLHRDATETRIVIRAATAAAPAVSLRWGEHIDPAAPVNDYVSAVLDQVLPVSGQLNLSDYIYRAPADGEFAALRVVAAADMRCTMISMQADWGINVLISAPEIEGDAAVPGQPVSLLANAQSRLVGGSIARFDVTRDGVLSQWPASNNSAVITLTFQGAIGETRSLVVVAVDDLGNRSTPTLHTVTLADNITPPAPSITSPTAGATGVGLTPQLSASAFVVANATHANTDWQIRAADGQTVVWQSLADTSHLTSITVPANTLSANTGYQAWVRYRTGIGTVTAWGSAGFTTLAVPAALAGEMSWTTPGNYTWTVPDGVTSASALVVDGSGGTVAFGSVSVEGSGGEVTLITNALLLTSSNGFSLTVPTSGGSYGFSTGIAAYNNDMPLTPGAQITVNVPGPDGAVRVIWGAGRSFPNNAASAGTQIGIVLVAEGGGAGQWQRVDGNFNPVNYPFGGAFFNSHPAYAGIVDQTIDGQAMVKVPKFWFKTGNVPSGQYAGKRYWMISDQAAPGFAVHPAFMNYGVEVPQYWLGKYQGTADGGKLGSQTGLMPLTNLDFPTMQARAVARNVSGVTGFMMWSIYQLGAVQMLCLIEMGSSDSQAVIGSGNIGYPSPGIQNVESAATSTATWRGVVGLWGNVFQRVDGLQSNENSGYMVWDYSGHRNYRATNLIMPVGGAVISVSSTAGVDYDLTAMFVPDTTDDRSVTAGSYGDLLWPAINGALAFGGSWGRGSTGAGLFAMLFEVASYGGSDVGTRLAKY